MIFPPQGISVYKNFKYLLFYNLKKSMILFFIIPIKLFTKIYNKNLKINFILKLILAGIFIAEKNFSESLILLNEINEKYGVDFSEEHVVWTNRVIATIYGKVLFPCVMFAFNYRATGRTDDNYTSSIKKVPSWDIVSDYFNQFRKTYNSKLNKLILLQLTHAHLIWANELRDEGKADDFIIAIKNILQAYSIKENDLCIVNILLMLRKYAFKEESGIDSLNYLRDIINEFKPAYPPEVWMCLYNIFIFNGLMQCGYVLRSKAIEQVLADAEIDQGNIPKNKLALFAAFDRNQSDVSRVILTRLKGKIRKKQYDKYLAYHYLISGEIKKAREIWDLYLSKADRLFADYFTNKKVAIVGPAPNELISGNEIDSFDIVVRFNYMGLNSLPVSSEFGTKINVSQYASTFLKIRNNEPEIYSEELDHYYVKHKFPKFVCRDISRGKAKILIKNKFLFNKRPIAVPAVLFDILHYNTSRVKVFKSNFFLSKMPYYKNYPGISSNKPLSKLPNFLGLLTYHDLISQLSFVRNLWEKNLIEVDENCKVILKMDELEYMKGMEELF